MEGYLVVVEGDYFGAASEFDRKREKYPYRITAKVPKPEGALSLIKNKLLDKILRRNYPNYHGWRTHQLVSITNLDGSKVHGLSDPRLMDFNDLADYVRRNKLPLKLELYTDLGYFRTMVYLAETNQHEFLIKQARLEIDHDEDKKLAELNPEIYGSQGSQGLEHSKPSQREVTKKALKESRRTTITEGKIETPKPSKKEDMFTDYVDESPPSILTIGDKPQTQKVERVFVAGKGYVPIDEFKEDFTREDEKEFETFDPHKLGKEIEDSKTEPETEGASVEDL